MVVHYQIKISDLYISWAPPQSFHVLPVYCISTQWGTMFLVIIRVFVFTFCVVRVCLQFVFPALQLSIRDSERNTILSLIFTVCQHPHPPLSIRWTTQEPFRDESWHTYESVSLGSSDLRDELSGEFVRYFITSPTGCYKLKTLDRVGCKVQGVCVYKCVCLWERKITFAAVAGS